MRNRLGIAGTLLCSLMAATISTSALGDFSFRDPRGLGEKTSAEPSRYWQSDQALPIVTAPPRPGQIDSSTPLSLPELTEFALRNNPKTRQAWLAARAAAANVGIEQADLLPQISGSLSATRSHPVSATSGVQSPKLERYGPSVTLSYVLFDFGVQADQVKAAEYRLLAANLSQNRTLQDVVFQVEQAYYRVIGLDALVRSNELTLKNIKTAYEAANKRRESGLATVADVYRVETQVAQAQLNLTRSRGEREKARGLLASTIGLPVNGTLKVQPLSSPPQIREITTSMTDLLDRAKAERSDLMAAEAQARAARASANATSKAGWPSIEIAGVGAHTSFSNNSPSASSYTLGLSLRIPLFTGFRDTYSTRQAEALAAQAEAARDVLFQQTELDVWQSYYDLQTAAGGVGSTESQLKSAEQTAQATLARYQAGFGSILDLITAQQDESNARVQRIQSFLDWFTAFARLNFSIGVNNILAATGEKK